MSDPLFSDPAFRAAHSGYVLLSELLDRQYPGQEPKSITALQKFRQGGPDPLDYIYIYHGQDPRTGFQYWHYVSFGMTELHEKRSTNAQISGWGFEFSFRLRVAAGENHSDNFTAPMWPGIVMQNLARYVFKTGNKFEAGHSVPFPTPIHAPAPQFKSLIFADDPVLQPQVFPNGRCKFLQMVFVTDDEMAAAGKWSGGGMAQLLAEYNPLLITDLTRESIFKSFPEAENRVNEGIKKDGSARGAIVLDDGLAQQRFGYEAGSPKLCVQLGLESWQAMVEVLPGRILFQREFFLVDGQRPVIFIEPAPEGNTSAKMRLENTPKGKALVIEMTPTMLETWCTGIRTDTEEAQNAGVGDNLWVKIIQPKPK